MSLPAAKVERTLAIAEHYPPFGPSEEGAHAAAQVALLHQRGERVEVVAPSPDGEEFIHLGAQGELVHRVSAERTYLLKPLRSLLRNLHSSRALFWGRALERALELELLWNRRFTRRAILGSRQADGVRSPGAPVGPARPAARIRSVDVVCCTYNREADLRESLPSLLEEVRRASAQGLEARLLIVFQNEGLPERLCHQVPLAKSPLLHFVPCFPPGLTRARNAGVAAGSSSSTTTSARARDSCSHTSLRRRPIRRPAESQVGCSPG